MPSICCNELPQHRPYSASTEADKRALAHTAYPPIGVAFEVRCEAFTSPSSVRGQAGAFTVFHSSPLTNLARGLPA